MIRKGKYASYEGKEFRFMNPKGNYVELISHNRKDKNNGFKHYDENIYIKKVPIEDLDALFYIHPKAKYKGELFPVSNGKDGKVLLDTSDAELAKKFGFERTDKYMYSKYVNEDEVEIVEEKKPYSIY